MASATKSKKWTDEKPACPCASEGSIVPGEPNARARERVEGVSLGCELS